MKYEIIRGILYADDKPVFTMPSNEKFYDVFDELFRIHWDEAVWLQNSGISADVAPEHKTAFSNGLSLFIDSTFFHVTSFRAMEADFGVLPVPKYDEAQEEYANLVTNHSDALVFPVTVSDIDRTMLITDAIGYESMLSLNECFYEVFLDEKLVRDKNSQEMIDIILDTKKFDLEWTANICGFVDTLLNLAQTREDSLASKWAGIRESAVVKLDDFVAKFND